MCKMTDREKILTQFAKIRLQIEQGDRSSLPRDWFESVIDHYEEKIKELQSIIEETNKFLGDRK